MSYKQGATSIPWRSRGGYAEVLDNVMTVLAPAAEFAGEIDTARAQRAKERAEKRWASSTSKKRSMRNWKWRYGVRWPGSRLRVKKQEDKYIGNEKAVRRKSYGRSSETRTGHHHVE